MSARERLLEAARERAEHERERELLDEVRESGVWGLDDTLKALQEENRVHHLLILWELEGDIRWSDSDGLAIRTYGDTASEVIVYTGVGRSNTGTFQFPLVHVPLKNVHFPDIRIGSMSRIRSNNQRLTICT